MAVTNQERIGKMLDLLKEGLTPFVERELKAHHAQQWIEQVRSAVGSTQEKLFQGEGDTRWDAASLLAVLWNQWNLVFRKTLGQAERTLVSELRNVRNWWAHQERLSSDDTDRALDSAARLLSAVSAPQADKVNRMKMDLRRLIYDEQVRREKRKAGGSLIETKAASSLKPWREVVTPHQDVASGRYQQAEFAADLWQVHIGEGGAEYRDPAEFFRRTYLTESLKHLLVGGVHRLSGEGGDPVVQLQTNFGGGKTHSMLALYHLFSGATAAELPGVDALLADAGVSTLPRANRVVLVGNRISPGNPVTKSDGTVVRTLWGETAWQLGERAGGTTEAKRAFARVQADDEKATNPGGVLRELFNDYGPCLILIDEWVAYARQLHDQPDLPAGTFETQFTFAQTLTEEAKAARCCLLLISLPASDTGASPHSVDDVEVGGVRGREALHRLGNVIGRVESPWRAATAEESFEIVRRRLFEPLAGPDGFKHRDVTARAFTDLYRKYEGDFPADCREVEYERRIQAAYPIHPEIFDRLYSDWSTLEKFQRTRGVLRLMASVIHSLWEKGDRNPLILPSMIPIDDERVRVELTRYLSDNWSPIIESDVDGPGSLPAKVDAEVTNIGRLNGTRRVARTIYLGSAPSTAAAHRGLEDRRIKLGCVLPGESPALFGDALRRLAAGATYLYQDGPRFWYATKATVKKLAEDRAEQLKGETDKVVQELERRLLANVSSRGDFAAVHALPHSSADVPDDPNGRLVVLGSDAPYSRNGGSAAEAAAQAILAARGSTPRLNQNALVFLAADKVRLQDLEDAIRRYLAWESIVEDKEVLNLDQQQLKQAEAQRQAANGTATARLPETYQWVLVPTQLTPQNAIQWQVLKLGGQELLAVRASKKLRADELLLTSLGATVLRKYLDDIPLWRGNHVDVRQLTEDFARYLYLPRLADSKVLLRTIEDGVGLLTWRTDTFGFAESFDETEGRYRGLRGGQVLRLAAGASGMLVKPDVAHTQLDAEVPSSKPKTGTSPSEIPGTGKPPGKAPKPLTRFHGTVRLDPARIGRDAGRIGEEVIAHLAGLVGADVQVTLEIEALMPSGASEQAVRTVTENARTLKFMSQGFEKE